MIQISEEPTKLDLLQSRVEQQVELICILKQRADEYLRKYMTAEEQLKSIEKEKENLQCTYTNERKQCVLLKQNINKLQDINKSLVELKLVNEKENKVLQDNCDELDATVKRLTDECKSLKAESLKPDQSDQINNEKAELQTKFKDTQELLLKISAENESYKIKMQKEVRRLTKELSSTKQELKETTFNFNTLQRDYTAEMKKANSCEQQIETLQSEIEDSKIELETLKKKLDVERKQHASENEKIKKEYLRKEKSLPAYALEEERKLMTKDLNAYKEHADQLLNKEKEINAKLRRLNLKSAGKTPKPPDVPRKQNTK